MFNKVIFVSRLRELIADCGITIKELAFRTGINKNLITNWMSESNKYMPGVKNLIKLADYFGCTIDYFIGISDDYWRTEKGARDAFPENLRKNIKKRNVTISGMKRDLNLSSTRVIYDWLNGRNLPQIDYLIRLSAYFGVSLEDLLGNENE